MKFSKLLTFLIAVLFLWPFILQLINIYPTLLWFKSVGYSPVFWTTLTIKLQIILFSCLTFFIIVALNVLIARHFGKEARKLKRVEANLGFENFFRQIRRNFGDGGDAEEAPIFEVGGSSPKEERKATLLWIAGIAFFGVLIGLGTASQWEVFLKFANASSFSYADPIFKRDIGFYVFRLPFLKFLQSFINFSVFIGLLMAIFTYVSDRAVGFGFKIGIRFGRGVKTHLALLFAAMMFLTAWGIHLNAFNLLYSERGVIFGAGYTDVHAQILAYNLQANAALLTGFLIIIFIFRGSALMPLAGFALYLLVSIIMGSIYPSIIQTWRVKPNEITMEQPYINYGIEYTRRAYGLNRIEERDFAADDTLTIAQVNSNRETIQNLRLLDPRPLKKTYRQLQEIRPYYEFTDVDIDRYNLETGYRQVMLSPREIDVGKLPEKAQSWINVHLKYTHGYGLCLSPVNIKTSTGLPDFFIKDIPPNSGYPSLKITRPEIYFGEKTNNYVVVNTKEDEFDYPKGDTNVYSKYSGTGGVKIGSLFGKLLFALKFNDIKILLTGYIGDNSRVLFNRNITAMAKEIAPFLFYDSDPYMVISGGRLYWILDGYTLSDLYPYSDPSGSGMSKFNYIRNSVKVTIDAYNGTIDYYVSDPDDPIIRTFSKSFPGLFKPLSALNPEIKSHLRYPYDLFMVQAEKYAAFHMNDAQVFYNQEDLWNLPKKTVDGTEQNMEAYYTIMRLPKKEKEEFLLMLPFTPNSKSNMIAWMAGRCDKEDYGKLIVYKFPKKKLVYGPSQVEARIDQETEISKQLTLWGQKGSRVIRGNLLAIPIEESLIYVEPLYLEAQEGELPELKRVIVSYQDRIAMEETLEGALESVFSGKVSRAPSIDLPEPETFSIKKLASSALEIYNSALSSLKSGNWNGFGENIQNLGVKLRELENKAK